MLKREEAFATIFATAVALRNRERYYVIQIKDVLALKLGARTCLYGAVRMEVTDSRGILFHLR
jgi:hypothetical protein